MGLACLLEYGMRSGCALMWQALLTGIIRMEPKKLLNEILLRTREVKQSGGHPLVVLDLDGTLFDNGPRTWQLVAEALEEGGYEAERQRLNELSNRFLPYLVADFLAQAQISNEDTVEYVKKFWFERFFTDRYQEYDVPLEGSVSFVKELYAAGATMVYLTGRDVPGMLTGCAQSLRANGYPVGLMRTMMILKPDFETKDLVFKKEAAEFISQSGTVVAAFDNEPGNCNLFLDAWPKAFSVFIDSTCAPNPPPLAQGVHTIERFE